MARRALLFATLIVAATIATAAAQSRRVQSDQEILIQLEHAWDDAFERKDVGFIGNVLADELVATYGDGSRGDKAYVLALAAEFKQQIDESSLDEFAVKVYGNPAVVWFWKRRTGPIKGVATPLAYRYVDVF